MGKTVHRIRVRIGRLGICHAVTEHEEENDGLTLDGIWKDWGNDADEPFRDLVIELTAEDPQAVPVIAVSIPPADAVTAEASVTPAA